MSFSLHLVLKHLGENQKTDIIEDIVQHLKTENDYENHAPHIDAFCELIGQSTKNEFDEFAYEYITNVLHTENPSTNFESILKISLKVNKLSEKLISHILDNLIIYIATNPNRFNQKITEIVDIDLNREKNYDLSSSFILNILQFTEWFFIHNESLPFKNLDKTLDKICYIFLTDEELEISKTSSKILKWRMASICQSDATISYLWKIIFALQDSSDITEKSFGYTLWLRFFGHFKSVNLKKNENFQQVISNEKYWYFLRDGLISITHEHKKFALTLIQLSVQSLSTNLSSPIIKWNCEKEAEYTESWKRFCTLYEILGIDAAMNQVQAATNDLLRIFALDSDIPVPFALAILSVGFKASMDRIKKFALKLTFSLPKDSLSLFKHDFKFISHVFLPFTMKSSHFTVQKLANGKFYSEFGDKIREFICDCIDSLDDATDISNLVNSIFDLINKNNLTFGIARIYIAWGVLDGLEKKHFRPLNISVLQELKSLFETTAEGDICRTTLQTIHLRMLLQFNPRHVTLRTYVQTLVHFIQMNGYKLYVDNEEFFLDYFNTFFQKENFVDLLTDANVPITVEEFVVVSSYLLSLNMKAGKLAPYILSHPKCPEILIQFASSGLGFKNIWNDNLIVSRVERLVNGMVDGSEDLDISIYADSAKLFNNVILFSNEFWMSMRLDHLFNTVAKLLVNVANMEEAKYYIAQFKFLSLSFAKCIFNEDFCISLSNLNCLLNSSLKKIPKGSDANFYKAKDELNSYILNDIQSLFKITSFDSTFKNAILDLADTVVSMSGYYSHLSNVNLLTAFLEQCEGKNLLSKEEARSIANILKLIWDDLIRDRLILSQRDLHQQFIKLLLHRKLIVASIDDDELAAVLYNISDDIIGQSTARKGLLPILFKAISEYQVSCPNEFEETTWIAKLIVKGCFLFQSEVNIFQLDCIIAEQFDKALNISGKSLYFSVYGDAEISYRVAIFAIVGSLRTSKFACEMWDFIFNNESVFHLLEPKKRTDREEQWKRIQFLSLFVATAEILEESKFIEYIEKYLLPRIFKEASPLCRVYIEWLICLAILRVPSFESAVFTALKEGVEAQQPLVVVTFERVSMLLSMQLSKEKETEFLTKFVVDIVIPLSSSNRALNRHFSSSMACVIYDEIKNKELEFSPLLKETLSKIYNIAHNTEDFGKYRSGDALLWNITKDLNLVSISGGLLLKVSDREIDAIYEKDYSSFLTEKQKSILRVPVGHDESDLWIAAERSDELKIESYYVNIGDEKEASSLLQTKSGVWSTVMDLDENVRAAAQIKRSPLIVVSSLVDKPPNLGGICRLCDCLGAGWMTVHDISVKEDTEFKNVAVTADRWMPLIEVKIEEIVDFMRLKKKEGYTLIGLEQTDKSVELNSDLKFPEKSLILLGKEREGIPGDLLAELDMCVIIKQVGIVRSMNIQTATAVIVHAYSSQHC
jgi:tRNA guanosine-2'-O-methyltransferase